MFSVAKELKEGKYVMIDDVPCRVVSIDSSKPGKHGAAKMRVVGMGIFDNQKKNLLVPSDADIEVPIIERKSAQVISVSGSTMQMMDTESFETYELAIPPELVGKVETGKECEMMEALGRRAVIRIKGE
ncbi:translation initiation factor IF-5A [Candidatus Micrarchaeota archaeon CG11_big_fil_rev_8_21_14_0_20_47_5]|nr:MAG: translation initiation factor IF-5A [Candidatus Micrarchaeota archaeon CG11_big_fil_rev_8_21_14_0_20_47_5]